MRYRTALWLSHVVYVSLFYNISISWLYLLNGWGFYFFTCVTMCEVKTTNIAFFEPSLAQCLRMAKMVRKLSVFWKGPPMLLIFADWRACKIVDSDKTGLQFSATFRVTVTVLLLHPNIGWVGELRGPFLFLDKILRYYHSNENSAALQCTVV